MGADFLVAYCRYPLPERSTFERAAREFSSSVRLDWIYDHAFGCLVDVSDFGYDVETSRENLYMSLLSAYDVATDQDRRDTSVLRVGEEEILVTGGMSWTGSPTGAYDSILLLAASGLDEAGTPSGEEDADEDGE
jgi:hypothetical protein